MAYGNVYVARVAFGAKAKEAPPSKNVRGSDAERGDQHARVQAGSAAAPPRKDK